MTRPAPNLSLYQFNPWDSMSTDTENLPRSILLTVVRWRPHLPARSSWVIPSDLRNSAMRAPILSLSFIISSFLKIPRP